LAAILPERRQQVNSLLRQALQRSPDERAPFLNRACGDDVDLRRLVVSLLEQDRQAEDDGFLEQAALKAVEVREDEVDTSEMLAATVLADRAALETDAPAGLIEARKELPDQIDRYPVRSRLGQGAFGTVYLVEDTELCRLVAIKVLDPHRFGSIQDMRSFLNEARTVARLNHPNIVPVYDGGHFGDSQCFVAMRYLEGGSLVELINNARPSFGRTAELMSQISAAVHFAHQKGVIHRDLKPANILIDVDGKPYVADFGLALHESVQRDIPRHYAGTVSYMSPEQVRRETHRLDGRTDIWALGVILYELLTARKPFQGKSPQEIEDEILHRDPKPPRQIDDKIPKDLERITLKCLCKQATHRYTASVDLAEDLRQCLRGTFDSDERHADGLTIPAEQFRGQALAPATAGDSSRNSLRSVTRNLLIAALLGSLCAATVWAIVRDSSHSKRIPSEFVATAADKQASPASSAGVFGTRLQITAFEARHYRYRGGQGRDLGVLGKDSSRVVVGDDVRLNVEFSAPAYAYLLSLNTDGGVQLCLPENADTAPLQTQRIQLYPDQADFFTLTEGEGLQAFVVLASLEPLPPYGELKPRLTNIPWESSRADGIWRFSAGRFEPVFPDAKSGTENYVDRGQRTTRTPRTFRDTCTYLQSQLPVDSIQAVAFSVAPEGP